MDEVTECMAVSQEWDKDVRIVLFVKLRDQLKLDDVTYYVGHETIVRREEGTRLPRIVETIFAYLQRNSLHVSDYFRLPADSVVELGREIAI